MATQTLARARPDEEPVIPDGDLERLLAEMFDHRRQAARPAAAPPAPRPVEPPGPSRIEPGVSVIPSAPAVDARPVRAPEPQVIEPQVIEAAPEDEAPEVEPLRLAQPPRKGRRLAAGLLVLAALGAGWWASGAPGPMRGVALIQNSALFQKLPLGAKTPPVIAAPPPAATRVIEPPAGDAASSAAPGSQPVASAPVPAAPQPTAALAPPRTVKPEAPPDSAGILGAPQIGPFDQAAEPRRIRTTAILPPRAAEADAQNAAPRQLDFDDPATWPAGAEPGEPHPLPPPRPQGL